MGGERSTDPGPTGAGPRFDTRFAASLRSSGIGGEPFHLLVALSGGLDSTVLLYLLRFRCEGIPLMVTAAHLDHRMRSSSGADADWVRGLCLAWGVPLESGIAPPGLSSEASARNARYQFLREVATRLGADRIVTAHHADDQAETVLFRALRGTGLAGLAGIPAASPRGLIRPMLPFWRTEIERFATENGIAWRTDPSNATRGPARNRLRLEILPEIERTISPAARRNLVSLAALARESEMGWKAVVRSIYPSLVSVEGADLLIARTGLRNQDRSIAVRVVRKALRRFGIVPDRAGTGTVLTFITDAPSGREIQLAGGVRIRAEFDNARVYRAGEIPPDHPLGIPLPLEERDVHGELRLGGVRYRVRARFEVEAIESREPFRWRVAIPLQPERFPLLVRARAPGDRFRTAGGTKSVKKLMIEHRVPIGERPRLPVVIDSTGNVLWIAGIGVASKAGSPDGRVLELSILDG